MNTCDMEETKHLAIQKFIELRKAHADYKWREFWK